MSNSGSINSIDISLGWVLVTSSGNNKPFNTIYDTNNIEIPTLFGWNLNGGYISYNLDLSNLEIGKGYWIKVLSSSLNQMPFKQIEVSSPQTINLNFTTGWNLIGSPYLKEDYENLQPTFNSVFGSISGDIVQPFKAFSYNKSVGYVEHFINENMELGKGYWLKFYRDTSLNITIGSITYSLANPPYSINISELNYYSLGISGAGGVADGSNVDGSSNTTFSDLSFGNGCLVNYKFKLIIKSPTTAKQFDYSNNATSDFSGSAPQYSNYSLEFISVSTASREWFFNELSFNNSSNIFNIDNSYIFPEYTYTISGYDMSFSKNPGYTNNPSPIGNLSCTINVPSRIQVTTNYINYLSSDLSFDDSEIQTISKEKVLNMQKNTGETSSTDTTDIYFFKSTDQISINYNNLINLRNSRQDSNLYGNDISGPQCYFKMSRTISGAQLSGDLCGNDLSGTFGGESFGNISRNPSNSYFSFSQSESKDALLGHSEYSQLNNNQKYRLRGWYLGVDVSNIKADICLGLYDDIANHNYSPYVIKFGQYDSNTDNSLGNEISYNLYISKDVSNITLNINNEISNSTINAAPQEGLKLYGVTLPDKNNMFTLDICNIDISNINPSWKPKNKNTLLDLNLVYEGNDILSTDSSINWPDDGWSSHYPDLSKTFIMKYDYLSVNQRYSRNIESTQQFQINAKNLADNVTYTDNLAQVSKKDIYFGNNQNNTKLWWDYTWPPQSSNFRVNNQDICFNTDLMNVGEGLYPLFNRINTSYNHENEISKNMMMWSNDSFRAGDLNGNDISGNPFINYTNGSGYFNYISSNPDYSIYNISGELLDITGPLYDNNERPEWYTSTNNIGVKFILLKINISLLTDIPTQGGSLGCNLTINNNPNIKLGHHYFLQILESTPNTNTFDVHTNIFSQIPETRSGWRDATKRIIPGTNGDFLYGHGAGCYTSLDSYPYKISLVSSKGTLNNPTYIYFRIGFPYNSPHDISSLQIDFSRNPFS